jgi:hypothetical protein
MKAEDLVQRLNSDPEYLARRAAIDARQAELRAECAADEQILVAEIQKRGYDIDSVWDLVNNTPHPVLQRRFLGPYPQAYDVLLRHLSLPHHPRVREGVIRALTVKDGGRTLEDALLREFVAEEDAELRWVLVNALRTAMPYHRRRRHPEIAAALGAQPSPVGRPRA